MFLFRVEEFSPSRTIAVSVAVSIALRNATPAVFIRLKIAVFDTFVFDMTPAMNAAVNKEAEDMAETLRHEVRKTVGESFRALLLVNRVCSAISPIEITDCILSTTLNSFTGFI